MATLLVIKQLADDRALFSKDADQIPDALKAVSLFSDASGLHLNIRKWEILEIHNNT